MKSGPFEWSKTFWLLLCNQLIRQRQIMPCFVQCVYENTFNLNIWRHVQAILSHLSYVYKFSVLLFVYYFRLKHIWSGSYLHVSLSLVYSCSAKLFFVLAFISTLVLPFSCATSAHIWVEKHIRPRNQGERVSRHLIGIILIFNWLIKFFLFYGFSCDPWMLSETFCFYF